MEQNGSKSEKLFEQNGSKSGIFFQNLKKKTQKSNNKFKICIENSKLEIFSKLENFSWTQIINISHIIDHFNQTQIDCHTQKFTNSQKTETFLNSVKNAAFDKMTSIPRKMIATHTKSQILNTEQQPLWFCEKCRFNLRETKKNITLFQKQQL